MTAKSPEKERSLILFPGSFDPFTTGHLDLVERALAMFDKVIVAIGYNPAKTSSDGIEQRKNRIRKALDRFENVEVTAYSGLTVDEAKRLGATAILRGVRSASDFDYERNMADVNRKIGGLETVILVARPELSFVSSSLVRELESFGHDVSDFLPEKD